MLWFYVLQGRMKFEKVHQIYKKFLDVEDIKPTLVNKISSTFT